MRASFSFPLALIFAVVSAGHAVRAEETKPILKDGVIRFFDSTAKDARIVHEPIGDSPLWVDAVRKDGKTRQVRFYSLSKDHKPVVLRFEYPFGEASATWSSPVRREGPLVIVELPYNGSLIGDRMDQQEGAEAADAARKSLGADAKSAAGLPVVYSSGDSISLSYWPYLEASLADTADLFYQAELAKAHPQVGLSNNGVGELAYGVLQRAYGYEDFKPRYVVMNFGLHMISRVAKKPELYDRWIVQCDELAKKHGAQLVWVTTTPYERNDANNKVVDTFNTRAAKVAAERGIPVIDLHGFVRRRLATSPAGVYADGLHFSAPVNRAMGEFIAGELKVIMKKTPAATATKAP